MIARARASLAHIRFIRVALRALVTAKKTPITAVITSSTGPSDTDPRIHPSDVLPARVVGSGRWG
jgi:hypothetical protein